MYIITRLYGLKMFKLTCEALQLLDSFHNYALRSILGLPKYTATAALYILTGQLPIQAQLTIKQLCFLRSLLESSPCRDIVIRQYVTKVGKTNSLIPLLAQLLYDHNLPTIMDLFLNAPSKEKWKVLVKTAVTTKATTEVNASASGKSTLNLLATPFKAGKLHPSLEAIYNVRQVARVAVKLKILTKTYPLQDNWMRIGKVKSAGCKLCDSAVEDTNHFVLSCPALEEVRQKYRSVISSAAGPHQLRELLNPSSHSSPIQNEQKTTDLLFALHLKRHNILNPKEEKETNHPVVKHP